MAHAFHYSRKERQIEEAPLSDSRLALTGRARKTEVKSEIRAESLSGKASRPNASATLRRSRKETEIVLRFFVGLVDLNLNDGKCDALMNINEHWRVSRRSLDGDLQRIQLNEAI